MAKIRLNKLKGKEEKSKIFNFLNCTKRNADENSASKPPPEPISVLQKLHKKPSVLVDKCVCVKPSQKDSNVQVMMMSGNKQIATEQNAVQKSEEKIICQKCLKQKKDKNPFWSQREDRYCRCREGGYCNTNTIIFPNEYKPPSFEFEENKYLELLKEIIKEETMKNCNSMSDFKREIDIQRAEIRELKDILLQSILEKSARPAGEMTDAETKSKEGRNKFAAFGPKRFLRRSLSVDNPESFYGQHLDDKPLSNDMFFDVSPENFKDVSEYKSLDSISISDTDDIHKHQEHKTAFWSRIFW